MEAKTFHIDWDIHRPCRCIIPAACKKINCKLFVVAARAQSEKIYDIKRHFDSAIYPTFQF